MHHKRTQSSGFSLVEVTIASLILSVLVLGMTFALQMESRSMRVFAELTNAELRSQEMLDRLERTLSYARGETPSAFLAEDLFPGQTESLTLDQALGFPDRGSLIVSAGLGAEECVAYSDLDAALQQLVTLERGSRCTTDTMHSAGARVLWAPLARPISNQTNPAPNLYDGVSQELFGSVYYEGDGSGFIFRSPVDPADTGSFVEDGDLRLGAMLEGGDDADGWSAIYFEAIASVSEATRKVDINRDGDKDDVFDLGQLRMRSWRASDANPAVAREIGLCPPIVLQEQCAWGSDLDGDGFSDPIFLFDERTQRLRIRLHVLTGTVGNIGVVKRKELALLLRNSDTN